ncbi:transketolase [Acidicapsa dinghuensis]|uniref:Transketolase n=1 Tax=Acidicapsa dinghuensis TaxID=2218256 RepID=A0ABW1EEP4_9BACT|nr:transketolase [Acidicapsa dinghuensis]
MADVATDSKVDSKLDPKVDIDQLSIDTLRILAVDTVQKANSGHPGAPLGCAPIGYLLFHKLMKHNPANSHWADRDRFVLSNGHASALIYGLLYLTGYKLSLDDLKAFRQWESKTPGHPESGHTDGVEVTTGPLGQGFAMSVGLAAAEKHLAAVYNKPGYEIVNHHTFGICGDGDLMEGISHEAASLAGTLGLGKLIFLYDDNLISLDGPTELSFTENVYARFEAYGWQVLRVADGNDLAGIEAAIEKGKAETSKPTLIGVRTIIGYGSPKAGTNKVHGEALGAEAVKATKKFFGFPEDQSFYVPDEALANWRQAVTKGTAEEAEWNKLFAAYKAEYPELAAEFERTYHGKRKDGWEKSIPSFATTKAVATRNAGQIVMNAIEKDVPELFGGAADLTASTKTIFKDSGNFHIDPTGRNVYFGVREFAMCAAVNGIAAHGGLLPFGSTFFTFTDYCKSALRMAAIMQTHALFIFTHDSVALGEDGPTHQPIEHLMALRAVPFLTDFRPADANETAAAWRLAVERNHPSFMALSRQDLPILDPATIDTYAGVGKGGYIVKEAENPDIVLIATGSEVWLAIDSAKLLAESGIKARVVSLPSWKIFDEQTQAYRDSILLPGVPKLAIEAGATLGWWKFLAGGKGDVIGLDRFGASAPGPIAMKELGFNPENVATKAKALLGK